MICARLVGELESIEVVLFRADTGNEICRVPGRPAQQFLFGSMGFDDLLSFVAQDLTHQQRFDILDEIKANLHHSQISQRLMEVL